MMALVNGTKATRAYSAVDLENATDSVSFLRDFGGLDLPEGFSGAVVEDSEGIVNALKNLGGRAFTSLLLENFGVDV